MMSSAQRHGELIAHLAAEGAVLREAQMMRIRWPSSANQTRLLGDEFDVVLVAKPTRFRVGQAALVDVLGNQSRARCCEHECRTGLSSDATGGNGTSITSVLAVPPRIISLAWNASSILRASAAVRLFLAPKNPVRPDCSVIS